MAVVDKFRSELRMLVLRRGFPWWSRISPPTLLEGHAEEKLSVILLSYRRPENMAAIVAACLACPFVGRVVLSNNNPALDIRRFVRARDQRLQIINQPARCFPSKRYELAREEAGRWFLCIDDDTFLTPRQIRGMFGKLLAEPEAVHGVAGENFKSDRSEFVFEPVAGTAEVDCLVWAFAFTRDHVRTYFDLLERVGLRNEELQANEDVVLSFSGEGRPCVHNFGTLHLCASRETPGVAVSADAEFRAARHELHGCLRGFGSES